MSVKTIKKKKNEANLLVTVSNEEDRDSSHLILEYRQASREGMLNVKVTKIKSIKQILI